MIKKQIRKLAYKAIVKNGKSHQEAYDEISQKPGVNAQVLVDELTKIPSSGKQKRTTSLRHTFIAVLVILSLVRILVVILLELNNPLDLRFLIFMIIIMLIAPGIGIYAALFGRTELYRTTGILLGITLLQSIRRGELSLEPESLIMLIPIVLATALAFYIPYKLKTPYKRIKTDSYEDGKLIKKIDYEFEDTRINESDILDSTF